MSGDDRFTAGLIYDVFKVLEQHGYERTPNVASGGALAALWDLVKAFEGRSEAA